MSLYEPIFVALERAAIRYVVVGGLATVLHGHARLTADVDLVIDLAEEEVRRTVDVLTELGLEPRLPVAARDFASAAVRRQWIEERGMKVFTMLDPDNPLLSVDLFAEHLIEFEALWDRSVHLPLRSTRVRVAAIPDLIELKRQAARPKDLADIQKLEAILRNRERNDD